MIHRSIEARLVLYPLFALSALLLYQGTNAGLYYLIGMGVYFWAFAEGEVSLLLVTALEAVMLGHELIVCHRQYVRSRGRCQRGICCPKRDIFHLHFLHFEFDSLALKWHYRADGVFDEVTHFSNWHFNGAGIAARELNPHLQVPRSYEIGTSITFLHPMAFGDRENFEGEQAMCKRQSKERRAKNRAKGNEAEASRGSIARDLSGSSVTSYGGRGLPSADSIKSHYDRISDLYA